MEQKTIRIKVGQPIRLCSPCALLTEDLLGAGYALWLPPAIHQKTRCEGCGRETDTLAYILKKVSDLPGTTGD